MQKRHLWIPTVLAALVISVASLAISNGITYAQSLNQVALVVQHGDGTTFTQCVEFGEEQITGFDVLQRAGLDLVFASGGGGAEICKIGPDGCDNPGDCWCQCKGKDCLYWSYWHFLDGTWRYSPLGASLYKVGHGAVEGWVWGIGTPIRAFTSPICCANIPKGTSIAWLVSSVSDGFSVGN